MKISNELLNRMDELTDEKYNFLEQKEKEAKADGERFNIDVEERVWYTMKIAELQLKIEEIQRVYMPI